MNFCAIETWGDMYLEIEAAVVVAARRGSYLALRHSAGQGPLVNEDRSAVTAGFAKATNVEAVCRITARGIGTIVEKYLSHTRFDDR